MRMTIIEILTYVCFIPAGLAGIVLFIYALTMEDLERGK